MKFIAWCIIFFLFSCLDIVTTYIATRNMSSSEMKERELNPIFGKIITKKSLVWLIRLSSTGLVIFILAFQYFFRDQYLALFYIAAISIAIILVTIQNTYAIWAFRNKHLSLGRFLIDKLHINRIAAYFILGGILTGLGFIIASLVYL